MDGLTPSAVASIARGNSSLGDSPSTVEAVDVAPILFVTWGGGGNMPPTVGLAEELRERGDSVRFLGKARQRSRIVRIRCIRSVEL